MEVEGLLKIKDEKVPTPLNYLHYVLNLYVKFLPWLIQIRRVEDHESLLVLLEGKNFLAPTINKKFDVFKILKVNWLKKILFVVLYDVFLLLTLLLQVNLIEIIHLSLYQDILVVRRGDQVDAQESDIEMVDQLYFFCLQIKEDDGSIVDYYAVLLLLRHSPKKKIVRFLEHKLQIYAFLLNLLLDHYYVRKIILIYDVLFFQLVNDEVPPNFFQVGVIVVQERGGDD